MLKLNIFNKSNRFVYFFFSLILITNNVFGYSDFKSEQQSVTDDPILINLIPGIIASLLVVIITFIIKRGKSYLDNRRRKMTLNDVWYSEYRLDDGNWHRTQAIFKTDLFKGNIIYGNSWFADPNNVDVMSSSSEEKYSQKRHWLAEVKFINDKYMYGKWRSEVRGSLYGPFFLVIAGGGRYCYGFWSGSGEGGLIRTGEWVMAMKQNDKSPDDVLNEAKKLIYQSEMPRSDMKTILGIAPSENLDSWFSSQQRIL